MTYIIVDEVHANGASQFVLSGTVNGFSNSHVTNVTKASGGAEKESIESIKFKATKFYTSQNRLVTLIDYNKSSRILSNHADAVAVWGGEDNDPPEYAVFVALKPQNSDYLSDMKRIKSKLNALNMLTVRPQVVDVDC